MADTKVAPQVATKEDIEKHKVNAILSYLGILIIVPLLSDDAKKSPYAKFHMNQGLVLTLAGIVLSMISLVPLLGWIAGFFGSIVLLVIWIMGFIGAINGEMKRVPILGDIELLK